MFALAGLIFGAGLVLAVTAGLPAPPSLSGALAQLSVEPTLVTVTPATSTRDGWSRLPVGLAQVLDRHVGVSDADLKILRTTRAELVSRKVTLALAGFTAPALAGLVLLEVGIPIVFPAALGLGIGALLWVLPSQDARERARTARLEFRSNLEVFLTLVAGERFSRGSVPQNLEESSAVSGSYPFTMLRTVIRRSAWAGTLIWDDLQALGEELAVPELGKLADIARNAGKGAAVYDTLLATADNLRAADLTDRRSEANVVSQRMSRPLSLLVTGLTLFVLIPFLARLLGG